MSFVLLNNDYAGDRSIRLRDILKDVKALLFDADGVLADVRVSTDAAGEVKTFFERDRFGIQEALLQGLRVGVISGSTSPVIERRLLDLGITDGLLVGNKLDLYEQFKQRYNLTDADCAYMGDDIDDLPVLEKVGFSCTPLDGHEYLRRAVTYISGYTSGNGCVRELIEMTLAEQGKWNYYQRE